MKETQLIKQILDYCSYRDLCFWRNQSGMIKTENNHIMKFGKAGSPDLVGCLKGRFIGVECKIGINRPTALQLAFGEWIKQQGGEYWVIYDLDAFIKKLETFKKILTP